MSARRVEALVRRIVQEIRRDHPSLALLFVAPIVITGLVAFILRGSATPAVDARIVNEVGPQAAAIVDAVTTQLRSQGAKAEVVADESTARRAVDDGSATVALILPADLIGAIAGGEAPHVRVLTRGLDPTAEGVQVGLVSRALVSAATGALGVRAPNVEHETLYGTASSDPVAPYAPAIVGFFAYFFVYILTGVSFLRERTGGTLERLLATPVARGEIVAGYALGFGLFATLQVAILLAWALGSARLGPLGPVPAFSIGLGIGLAGSPLLAFVVVLLLALGAVSLGIFLSTFARTELQIIQFIPIVLAPQFLLSGVIFPVASLPEVLRPLTAIMPLTYAVDGLRQVFVRGADLAAGALQLDLAVLAIVALFFAIIASLTIRREIV
ncbi:MAG TPA: ABC transporter permease [Candidatus Limnocylindrales bacterium]|nr:ABC transporter permease [Candidatus Limnocylindrales bacterium]